MFIVNRLYINIAEAAFESIIDAVTQLKVLFFSLFFAFCQCLNPLVRLYDCWDCELLCYIVLVLSFWSVQFVLFPNAVNHPAPYSLSLLQQSPVTAESRSYLIKQHIVIKILPVWWPVCYFLLLSLSRIAMSSRSRWWFSWRTRIRMPSVARFTFAYWSEISPVKNVRARDGVGWSRVRVKRQALLRVALLLRDSLPLWWIVGNASQIALCSKCPVLPVEMT